MDRPQEIERIIKLKRQAVRLILRDTQDKINRIYDDIDMLKMELYSHAESGPNTKDTTAERRL